MATCALAAVPKKAVEASPWQIAEQARQQLLDIPAAQRTAADYRTVMDAYRIIYHGDPASIHAPESIYTVGLLLADEGSTLHDAKALNAALGQMEFLRTQYPRSSFRIAALLAEAHMAADDLHDVKLARAKYGEFVEQYPQSTHIDEAKAALQQLRAGGLPKATDVTAPVAARNGGASNGVPASAVGPELHAEASLAASQGSGQPGKGQPAAAGAGPAAARSKSGLAMVSAIRHWSTPTYTRVAIDLGDEVEYEAARVPSPDRIYFDLHGTKLAQELAGKSFAVTDDGFLKRIRAAQYTNDMTRVVLDVNDVTEYTAFLLPNPYRLIIDIHGGAKTTQAVTPSAAMDNMPQPLTAVGVAPAVTSQAAVAASTAAATVAVPSTVATRTTSAREVTGLSAQPDNQRATARPTTQPIVVVAATQAVVAKSGKKKKDELADGAVSSAVSIAPGRAATPTADGHRSLVRALGLKIGRIVIDPGHGGHDSGTIGAGGIMEKDVVLDVALRLGKLLHDKLGAEITYTRSDDTFIPLETRTAIANKAQADLFISVHANSSNDETARGVETYYLNFTSQPDALDVAARENAVSEQSVHQLADLVKKITLKDKIDESKEFAGDVEQSLYEGLHRGNDGLKNRGVKKAPFVVLIGANMPSILTEISFVTNGKDAAQLRTPDYRERVAESIYRGVARYTGGLSAVRTVVASGE